MTDHESIKAELRKKLNPAYVKPPPQGKYGSYIEGWHAIAEANRIFGEDGWSYTLDTLQLTNASDDGGKHRVGYMAQVTVHAMGCHRGDVGHGQGFGKSEGDAHDSAVKEAVTDALKRALRTFGNPFGLALYDKSGANVGEDEPTSAERRDRLKAAMSNINDAPTLEKFWGQPSVVSAFDKLDNQHKGEVSTAYTNRMAQITQENAA